MWITESDDFPKSSASLTETMTRLTTTTTTTTATAAVLTAFPTITQALDDYNKNNYDEMEISELPPVWVPIIFAVIIIGGVGLLTASLGDVYTEEASLGLMSGAKAKKEKERSRSSYFKNKQR